MGTTTKKNTYQDVLDRANPQNVPDVLRKVKLGSMLSLLKVTVTGLTAAAAVDITAAATLAAATINVGALGQHRTTLPPIGLVRTLRVTAGGTGAEGARTVSDADATASATVAKLSDDGKTLTFEGTVTGFIIEYFPLSEVDLTSEMDNQV
jgi:hypothetical protein